MIGMSLIDNQDEISSRTLQQLPMRQLRQILGLELNIAACRRDRRLRSPAHYQHVVVAS
jgi:hypothetical protein